MRKHGTITACAGVGRLPPPPNRRERARATKPSERRPPFWKARSRLQELQAPQVPRRRQTQKRQRRIALSIPHLSCEICTFERGFCHKRSQGQRLLGRACMPSRAALRGRRRAPNHHAQSRRHAGSRQPRSVKTALEPNRAGRRRPRTRPEA